VAAVLHPADRSLPCAVLHLSGVSYGDRLLPQGDEVKCLGVAVGHAPLVTAGADEPHRQPPGREEWASRADVKIVTTVDPGGQTPDWKGEVGYVTPVVEATAPQAQNAVAVLCGPPIVVKLTLPELDKLGFADDAIFTTLENRMKCGRCNIGPVYVCKDGPVFTAAQLKGLPAEL